MKLFDTLDDSNILLYAAKHYYKPNVIDAEEFYDDLKRFMYLKRLLNRYYNTGELAERLILNDEYTDIEMDKKVIERLRDI